MARQSSILGGNTTILVEGEKSAILHALQGEYERVSKAKGNWYGSLSLANLGALRDLLEASETLAVIPKK